MEDGLNEPAARMAGWRELATYLAARPYLQNAMNTRMLLVVGFVMIPVLAATAQLYKKGQINVSGSAEIKVVPDEVDLKVGVETRDASLEAARRQNDERISKALHFLKKNGVKDEDVKTDYIAIEPVYDDHPGISLETGLPLRDYDKTKLVEPAYYQVRKSIGIKLINVANFDQVLAGLITNGVNHVLRVEFGTSELRKYKDQARAKAVQAAKEKAQAMASALGVKVGKPSNITVNDWSGWTGWSPPGSWAYGGGGGFGGGAQNVSQSAGGGSGDTGPTVAVGQISISANVSVTFRIE